MDGNENIDIKVRLQVNKGIMIWVNGEAEKLIPKGLSKESLSEKPVKHLIPEKGRWLTIGFNLNESQLWIRYHGVLYTKLPVFQAQQIIYRNKIENQNKNGRLMQTLFHMIYEGVRYVVQVTHNFKVSSTVISCDKNKTVFKGKKLRNPNSYPMVAKFDDLGWKVKVSFDPDVSIFTLEINGQTFMSLPYRASVDKQGPQNINRGNLWLNGTSITKSSEFESGGQGYLIDWSEELFQERRETTECTEPISEVCIGGFFQTSSIDVLNSVIDIISSNLEENGLKKLDIEQFNDQNTLQEWPLSQLLGKSQKCEAIRVSDLTNTTEENRITLLNFVTQVCTMCDTLEKLVLSFTGSTAQTGMNFLSTLASADSTCLQTLNIIGESKWFECGEEGNECITSLNTFLKRQVNLKQILMPACGLTVEQQEQICEDLDTSNCQIQFQ